MSRNGSGDGGTEGRQETRPTLFSAPAKTRSEELKRVQLLGGKKHLAKTEIQDSATSMTYKEFATTAPATSEAWTDGPGSQGCSNKSLTHDLVQLLVSEIAHMRCTLDGLAQEVQRSNKLLALALVSGPQLKYKTNPCVFSNRGRDVPGYVATTEKVEKLAELVLETISPQCKCQRHLNANHSR